MTVFRKTNGRCFYCNKPADVVDHFIPKKLWREWVLENVLGKVDQIGNLFPSCCSCNSSKGGRPVEDFAEKLGISGAQIHNRSTRANQRIGLEMDVPRNTFI